MQWTSQCFVCGCVCLWPHPEAASLHWWLLRLLYLDSLCFLCALAISCMGDGPLCSWAFTHLFFCPWEALDFVRWPRVSQKRSDDVLPRYLPGPLGAPETRRCPLAFLAIPPSTYWARSLLLMTVLTETVTRDLIWIQELNPSSSQIQDLLDSPQLGPR